MTGSVAGQHYGTQNAQGRCAAIAANAEEPLETGGDTEPLRKGTTSGRIGPPEVVCVIPSGSDCHPEQTRGIFSNVIVASPATMIPQKIPRRCRSSG